MKREKMIIILPLFSLILLFSAAHASVANDKSPPQGTCPWVVDGVYARTLEALRSRLLDKDSHSTMGMLRDIPQLAQGCQGSLTRCRVVSQPTERCVVRCFVGLSHTMLGMHVVVKNWVDTVIGCAEGTRTSYLHVVEHAPESSNDGGYVIMRESCAVSEARLGPASASSSSPQPVVTHRIQAGPCFATD
jgi:hypothetical protein